MSLQDAHKWLDEADALIVTTGNGFAKSEGLDIFDEVSFKRDYPEIVEKYHVNNIATALEVDFDSWEEKWTFWSKLVNQYSLNYHESSNMKRLAEIIRDKPYFVANSNFGHFFENSDFDERKLFNVAGDWTKMQCSSGYFHGKLDASKVIQTFLTGNGEVPRCSECGTPMELYLPLNKHFYPDEGANTHFRWFLTRNQDQKVVVLALGVEDTDAQLRDSIAALVAQFPTWHYIANQPQEGLPEAIQNQSIGEKLIVNEFLTELKG